DDRVRRCSGGGEAAREPVAAIGQPEREREHRRGRARGEAEEPVARARGHEEQREQEPDREVEDEEEEDAGHSAASTAARSGEPGAKGSTGRDAGGGRRPAARCSATSRSNRLRSPRTEPAAVRLCAQ